MSDDPYVDYRNKPLREATPEEVGLLAARVKERQVPAQPAEDRLQRELTRLRAVLMLAREHGALIIDMGDLRVELGPEPVSMQVRASIRSPAPTSPAPALCCQCSHDPAAEHDHNGLCLHGCPEELCRSNGGAP